jgi:GGDEF domain-containing protein
MPLRGQSAKDRHKAWLDFAAVAIAGSMALWYVEVGPSVAAHIPAHHELAVTDVLIGLANRGRLYDALRLALGREARNRRGVAAMLVRPAADSTT